MEAQSAGLRIDSVYSLQEYKTSPKRVSKTESGGEAPVLESQEYPFISITPRSSLTQWCYDGSKRQIELPAAVSENDRPCRSKRPCLLCCLCRREWPMRTWDVRKWKPDCISGWAVPESHLYKWPITCISKFSALYKITNFCYSIKKKKINKLNLTAAAEKEEVWFCLSLYRDFFNDLIQWYYLLGYYLRVK